MKNIFQQLEHEHVHNDVVLMTMTAPANSCIQQSHILHLAALLDIAQFCTQLIENHFLHRKVVEALMTSQLLAVLQQVGHPREEKLHFQGEHWHIPHYTLGLH